MRRDSPDRKPRARRPYVAAIAVLFAVAAWMVFPALHLGDACCGHDHEAEHAHAECDHGHAHGHEHGHEPADHDEPCEHDPTDCAVCQLALLTPTAPVALATPLPVHLRQVAPIFVPAPAPWRAPPVLTDAPPRGPPDAPRRTMRRAATARPSRAVGAP